MWSWLLDPTHGYSVRDAYRFITNFGDQVDRSIVDDVWHRNIPAKVSLFLWRLLRDRLPVRANLLMRNILSAEDSFCAVGCEVLETSRHLFLECDTSTNLWYHVWNSLGLYAVSPCELCEHHIQFTNMAGLPYCTNSFIKGIWFACAWVIWKDHNNHIFKNATSHHCVLIEKIKITSFLWVKAKQPSFVYSYFDWWVLSGNLFLG